MKNLFLLSFILFLGLNGCKSVDIEDGKIPKEYQVYAEKFIGDYSGAFSGHMNKLNLSMVDDRLVASFQEELLNEGCESVVGILKKINLKGSESNPSIKNVEFSFSAGKCKDQIMGNRLILEPNEKNNKIRIDVRIFSHWDTDFECRFETDPMRGGRHVCQDISIPVYSVGDFIKID